MVGERGKEIVSTLSNFCHIVTRIRWEGDGDFAEY